MEAAEGGSAPEGPAPAVEAAGAVGGVTTATVTIVRLNVGGRLFQSSASTLLWPGPNTFFAALLSDRLPSLLDETQAYFIDRDPDTFAMILSYLRTRHVDLGQVPVDALRVEADFYGLDQLSQELNAFAPRVACGGILFDSFVPAHATTDGPVVAIAGASSLVAVAHHHVVTCWNYSEATGWTVEARSAHIESDIHHVAITGRSAASGGVRIAVAAENFALLWEFNTAPGRDMPRPYSPPLRDSDEEESHQETLLQSFDLTVHVDEVLFINRNLVALSKQGKIGVRNARTHVWHSLSVAPICCTSVAGNLLLFGSPRGILSLVDLEKFPLKMSTNDLLVSTLYTDPCRETITALSVYLASSDRSLEIAYGTHTGNVRVVLQHPETVGQPPLLYQTFQVHQSEIRKVVLSENSLISVCACDNHVRTWRIARFRGRISTQPGSQALASFSVPSVDPWQDVGPFGDLDQQQIFIQWTNGSSSQLLLRIASTGDRICFVDAVDRSAISATYLHEGGMASRAGSRSRRLLCTGHANGSLQVWDLTGAIDWMAAENHRTTSIPRATGATMQMPAMVAPKEEATCAPGRAAGAPPTAAGPTSAALDDALTQRASGDARAQRLVLDHSRQGIGLRALPALFVCQRWRPSQPSGVVANV